MNRFSYSITIPFIPGNKDYKVSVYVGARTPELKVTGKTGYHLGQQARWSSNVALIIKCLDKNKY